jgi:uncharacterized protein YjlB
MQRAATLDRGTGGGMIKGKEGDGMHRMDSIEVIVVLDGETNIGYPGEDGQVHELTIKAGDVIVNNGTFHSWHNRSPRNCSMLFFVIAAKRETSVNS